MNQVPVPDEARPALERATEAAKRCFGADLQGVLLYGSATRGAYVPGKSDLNLLIVLAKASAQSLRRFHEAAVDRPEGPRVQPYILRTVELPLLARHFPTRLFDMQRSYVVMAGEDVLAPLRPDPQGIVARSKQELFNLLVRLRHEVACPPAAGLQTVLLGFLRAFTKGVRDLLWGLTGEQIDDRARLFETAAARWDLDARALRQMNAWRSGELYLTDEEAALCVELLLEAIEKVVGACE